MSSDLQDVHNFIGIITNYKDDSDLLLHLEEMRDVLVKIVIGLKEQSLRESLPSQLFDAVSLFISFVVSHLLGNSKDLDNAASNEIITVLTECFRLLRNACAGCLANQQFISSGDTLLVKTSELGGLLLTHIDTTEADIKQSELTCLRCLVQFLGNAVADFAPNQKKVWNLFKELLGRCVGFGDAALCSYSSMVVYNCMGDNRGCRDDLLQTDVGVDLVSSLLQLLKNQDLEWGLYILEALLKEPSFVKTMYEQFTLSQRDLLLGFVSAQLETGCQADPSPSADHVTSECATIHEENLLYVGELFKNDAHVILGLNQRRDVDHLVPELVMCQLSILCSATARPDRFPKLLQESELIKCCINLLHCTKMLGLQGDNLFTNADKLSQQGALNHTVHPVFGLKRDLIRLLSNMAYRNKANQDLIGHLGGIQLILDHTNIDGRNPFITQWAVFAIRNLCDKNMDNQAIVSGLKLEGLADSVQELREFGVQAELQGDKIVVTKVSDSTLEQPNPFSNTKRD